MQAITLLRTSALAFALMAWAASSVAADLGVLRGHWSGVWYIGMSSGKAQLVLDHADRGRISFTNLTDEFGDDALELSRMSFDGETLTFLVPSKGSANFAISLKSKGEGHILDGGGKFDGAIAKLVFNKDE